MASNYNINDMVNYLDRYNQQQNIPQYQVTPEQMQAYANVLNLRGLQQDQRLDDIKQLEQARKEDDKLNRLGMVANMFSNLGNQNNPLPTLTYRDWSGNVIGQYDPRQGSPNRVATPYIPTNKNVTQAQQQIALNEQARQQQLANAQEMAKFQEAIAVANQYNIPIGQAMELTGKDILGFEKDRATAQAGITKEQIGTTGDLFNTVLKGQQEQQLAEFNAKEKLNQQKQEYLYKGLLAIQEGNIQRGIEEMKQAGLNERQQAELLNRMNIAKVQAQAQTDAAAARANATIEAAKERNKQAVKEIPYGVMQSIINNEFITGETPESKAAKMYYYRRQFPEMFDDEGNFVGYQPNKQNQQNANTMNNFVKQQGDAYFQ